MSINYKRGVPSTINRAFHKKRVDAAFISSIEAKKYKNNSLGIVAKKDVLSVMVLPSEFSQNDTASATSNMLAKVLGVKGRVVIGDNALRLHYEGVEYIDLAKAWHSKNSLPFVFALLCYHKKSSLMKDINRAFLKKRTKIPYYILEKASKNSQISKENILNYLKHISYDVDAKAQRSLKKFYALSKKL